MLLAQQSTFRPDEALCPPHSLGAEVPVSRIISCVAQQLHHAKQRTLKLLRAQAAKCGDRLHAAGAVAPPLPPPACRFSCCWG